MRTEPIEEKKRERVKQESLLRRLSKLGGKRKTKPPEETRSLAPRKLNPLPKNLKRSSPGRLRGVTFQKGGNL